MVWSSEHLSWLQDNGHTLHTADGKPAKIFEFKHQNDGRVLSAWAKHFRNHYCRDDEIDDLCKGYGCSHSDYLRKIKFPDGKDKPGPSVRAGDFGEILVADYVQFALNYVVPRTRYLDKDSRNESKKGIDVIGFKQLDPKPTSKDELITFEVKCALSRRNNNTLQRAINDSCKDFNVRKAESLNAVKQRLRARLNESVELIPLVERFQNIADRPYKETSGAAAVHSNHTYVEDLILTADASSHPNGGSILLIAIRGNDMMKLVHELYRRAANEA